MDQSQYSAREYQPRITAIHPVTRRVLLLCNSADPGADPFDRPGAMAELIGRIDPLTVTIMQLEYSAAAIGHYWRDLYGAVTAAGTVQVLLLSSRLLWRGIVPALVLARYFGRSIAVHIDTDLAGEMTNGELRVFGRVLRMADRVTASPTADISWMGSDRYRVARLQTASRIEGIPARVIRQVQPKVLCFVGSSQTGTVATLVRGLELVKRKYPRAELVVATVGEAEPAFSCCGVQQPSVSCVAVRTLSDIRALVSTADMMVDLSLSRTTLPLHYAMAAGLPVVALRLAADPYLHDGNAFLLGSDDYVAVADTITAMVEKPDATEAVSRGVASSGEWWVPEILKRHWTSHFEHLQIRHM